MKTLMEMITVKQSLTILRADVHAIILARALPPLILIQKKEFSRRAARGLIFSNANEVLRSRVAIAFDLLVLVQPRDATHRSPRSKQTAVDCRSARTNARSLAPRVRMVHSRAVAGTRQNPLVAEFVT